MQEKKYGEFDNFDDFLSNLMEVLDSDSLSELDTVKQVEQKPSADGNQNRKTIPDSGKKTPVNGHRKEKTVPASEKRLSAGEKLPERRSESRKPEKTYHSKTKHPAAKENAKSTVLHSVPFLAVLCLVTVIAWLLPLRPTMSVSEKRNLDTFPEFSVKTFASGDYFSSIESWFSDTFTFRENWINMSNRFENLYGLRTVAIYGDVPTADAIPVPAAPLQAPAQLAESTPEPEPVQPAESEENSESPEIEEVSEETPEETEQGWGGLVVTDDDLIADRGAKLQIGDSVFVYPGFSQDCAERYAGWMNKAAELLEGKANFYSIVAPHSVSCMLSREDRNKYGFVIEEDALDYMYSLMNDNVGKVNVIDNLQKHNSEYIYFRTDPHWTAVGAYYAYEEWCRVAGKVPVPLSEYEEIVWENFYGTYYYASQEPKELRDNPDDVHAFIPPGDVHLYVDMNNGDRLGSETDILLDRSVRQTDQYVTFLGSDDAKATFINNDIQDESACLVLKTSFGNPFVYYLSQHYHYVYVVDMRYYYLRGITSFVEEFNVDDVIMIHATDLCYSDGGLSTVSKLIH